MKMMAKQKLEQIQILKKIQDAVLELQTPQLSEKIDQCPKCGGKLLKKGFKASDFYSVFTDHKVKIQKHQCISCKWNSVPELNHF